MPRFDVVSIFFWWRGATSGVEAREERSWWSSSSSSMALRPNTEERRRADDDRHCFTRLAISLTDRVNVCGARGMAVASRPSRVCAMCAFLVEKEKEKMAVVVF
jgi:hypothetical protein